ncbi:Uncharacterised protein [Streptococcus pneumoniae]|nr:Uncharacterised protein [Streptococcus pneumoniae]
MSYNCLIFVLSGSCIHEPPDVNLFIDLMRYKDNSFFKSQLHYPLGDAANLLFSV